MKHKFITFFSVLLAALAVAQDSDATQLALMTE